MLSFRQTVTNPIQVLSGTYGLYGLQYPKSSSGSNLHEVAISIVHITREHKKAGGRRQHHVEQLNILH